MDYAEAYMSYAARGIPQIDTACPGVALGESEDCSKRPFMDGNPLINGGKANHATA